MLPQSKIPSGMVREALVVVASKIFISQSSQASVGRTGQTSPIHVVFQLTGLMVACQDLSIKNESKPSRVYWRPYLNKSELLWEPTWCYTTYENLPIFYSFGKWSTTDFIVAFASWLFSQQEANSSYLSFANSSVSVSLIFQSWVPPERGVPFPACWSGFKPSYWSQGVQLVCQPA